VSIRIGILYELPQEDGGAEMLRLFRLGFDDTRRVWSGAAEHRPDMAGAIARLDDVELVYHEAAGYPRGAASVCAEGSRTLAAQGVVAIIGPAISDNAIACTAAADELRVPHINWSGSQRTRSEWMFHYQIGSLEEEAYVIARHLVGRGLRRVAVVEEQSIIGREYNEFLHDAAAIYGLELVGVVPLSASGDDGAEAVARLDALTFDAAVYFGLGLSSRGLGLAMRGRSWPVVTNSALMFGYVNPDWTADFEGWAYVDAVHEANPELQRLAALCGREMVGPSHPGHFDMSRLVANALVHAPEVSPDGMRVGLERVKQLPAAIGEPGTIMGFGNWKRGALEGGYLVLRRWERGRSVLV
jgi:branched-chain amino acid transport system substrate-binding protein